MPLLDLGPDPFERGQTHGRAMTAAIRDNLETYFRRFEAGGQDRARVVALGEEWTRFIEGANPEYFEEMRGIAAGAEIALRDIGILNARWEIAYSVMSKEAAAVTRPTAEPDGCTAFGLLPEATKSGHTVIGQNWDWLQGVLGRTFVMRVRRTEKPSFVGFTEAGIVGCKIGVNEAGIGLCLNGMVTREDGTNPFQKPIHVRAREILDARTFDKALLPVVQADRVCSANFLIGHGDGEIIDIEATPNEAAYLYPVDGLIAHSNHLVSRGRAASEFERLGPHTLYRAPRLDRLLRRHLGRVEVAHIQAALADHFSAPNAICRHPDPELPEPKRVITVTSVILDLTARTMLATAGQPCSNPYVAYMLHPDANPLAAVAE